MTTRKHRGRAPTENTTLSYIWRDIDAEFWARVKARAALRGLSLKEVLPQALALWMDAQPGNLPRNREARG